MQEYLNTETYEYKLAHSKPDGGWVEIPVGAEVLSTDGDGVGLVFWKDGFNFVGGLDEHWDGISKSFKDFFQMYPRCKVLWQRPTQPEALPFIDDEPQSLNDQYAEIEQARQHRHYFKDVSNLNEIDVYMVLKLFNVTDPCLQHIVKKALCAGQRGHKDLERDLKDILDTAKRAVDINKTY